jgi:hypothetical protein
MKIIRILILLICLIELGCGSSDKVNDVYIFKYGIDKVQNSESLDIYNLPVLMCFNEDSISFLQYEIDKTTINSKNETVYYEQTNSTIRLFKGDEQEILEISFKSTDSLILTGQNENKSVFIPLPRYRQKSKELNIRERFQKYGFKWNSTDNVIEFDSMGYFSWSQIPTENYYSKRWELKSYDDELFLLNLDFRTDLIHIKNYKDGVIEGVFYSEKDQLITLNSIELESTFDSKDLIGEWEEILDENIPPPPIINQDDFQLNEKLNFGKEFLIRKKYNRIDTIKWFASQFNNKILLSEEVARLGNQWNVLRIENNILTIERYNISAINGLKSRENIEFKRKINEE